MAIQPQGTPTSRIAMRSIQGIRYRISVSVTAGKTYLAVACAVDALEREQVRRIMLVRPAVRGCSVKTGLSAGDLARKSILSAPSCSSSEMIGFNC
jgi:phosphate starvation-inducible PhoH-like protein